MKLQITQTQIEELSLDARQKYIAWTIEKGDYTHVYRSIHDLIQFIDEHVGEGRWSIEREGGHQGWHVHVISVSFAEDDQPEMVDALWEAVKVLLEREEA